jgi:hypothetical protein
VTCRIGKEPCGPWEIRAAHAVKRVNLSQPPLRLAPFSHCTASFESLFPPVRTENTLFSISRAPVPLNSCCSAAMVTGADASPDRDPDSADACAISNPGFCAGSLSMLRACLGANIVRTDGDRQLLGPMRVLDDPAASCQIAARDDLASALWTRWEQHAGVSSLEACIEVEWELVDLHPPGHPGRAVRCDDLALSISVHGKRFGDRALLAAAIPVSREVLSLRLGGHPNRAASCIMLANALTDMPARHTGQLRPWLPFVPLVSSPETVLHDLPS